MSGLNLGGVEAPTTISSAQPALDDEQLITLAYCVGMGVIWRHADGDPNARDVPIGAVAYDLSTGRTYTGYPRDRELGDPTAHAEPTALGLAEKDGAKPNDLRVATTFEPCPACLEHMADVGIGSVVFGTERATLEHRGLVKKHAQSAMEIAAGGRDGLPYPLLIRIGSPALRAACDALFDPFGRDPVTEQVTFVGGHEHLPSFGKELAAANGQLSVVLNEANLLLGRFFDPGQRKIGLWPS